MWEALKASEYAKFCYLHVVGMKKELEDKGYVSCMEGYVFTDWDDLLSCSVNQFKQYYEDPYWIEQDIPLEEALNIAGLGG